jgi:hypothetical protein
VPSTVVSAAALAHLEFDGDWSEIEGGSLVFVRIPVPPAADPRDARWGAQGET